MENIQTYSSKTRQALQAVKNEEYEKALSIYTALAEEIGPDIYYTNIKLIQKKVKKNIMVKSGRKKRICIITHELTYTGAPGSSLRMALCLRDAYEVEMVSPVDGNFKKEIENHGIQINIIAEDTIDDEKINYFKAFDIVIVNCIAASQFVHKLKDHVTTIWYIREGKNIRGYAMKRQKELTNYPYTVCVSEYAAEFVRKNYTPYVQILHNCVIDRYTGEKNTIDGKIKILFCGTISERKGLDILLAAISSMDKKYHDSLELHIVGRKLDCFKKFWSNLNLNTSWIIDHGEIADEKEKEKLFKKMNVFIVPSRDESFSNVTLEGLMHGKVVIISSNVGAKEILDKTCSFVFEDQNVAELRSILEHIIVNTDLISCMGKNARKVYEAKGTIECYREKLLELVDGWISIKRRNNKQEFCFKSYQDLIETIKGKISFLRELNITKVVGIPRSGMIPAYLIGFYLNIPVYTIFEYVEKTRNSMTNRKLENRIGKTLVIDDSVLSGASIIKAQEILEQNGIRDKCLYSAVYATRRSRLLVDYHFEETSMPRIFEWNYLNHNHCINWAFDIDGVLCIDPTEEENDDGESYINFLLNAKPLYIPKYTIGALITSRLEKYRRETELWLKKNNVKYNHLIMLDLPSKRDRIQQNAHARIKWQHYGHRKDLYLFVESDERQAIEIAKKTGKNVICVTTNKIY